MAQLDSDPGAAEPCASGMPALKHHERRTREPDGSAELQRSMLAGAE